MGKERLIEADIFNAKAHAFTDSPIEFKGKLREVLDLTLASNHERAIFIASLSGVVEPMAAVIGAGVVILAQPILPYALGFAAGAMIFVVVKELVPESQRGGNTDLATMGTMIGFAVMMVLDVSFGQLFPRILMVEGK